MKIVLSLTSPVHLESEALVAVVLDAGDDKKPEPRVQSADKALQDVAADFIASG